MEFTPKDIITILIFIALLYVWGGTQTDLNRCLKSFNFIGLCTFGLSILNQKKVFKVILLYFRFDNIYWCIWNYIGSN